jgi:hypothetical protein
MMPLQAQSFFSAWQKAPLLRGSTRLGQKHQRGSALVELPFIVLMLVVLLLIVADLGRVTPWAQQVAYSADAGAHFAYQKYDQMMVSQALTDEQFDCENPISLCDDPRDQAQNAVGGLGLEPDDIDVRYFWKCRAVDYVGTTLTVQYNSDNEDVSRDTNCSNLDCGSEKCLNDSFSPLLFIEVSITASFEPKSIASFITERLPSSLTDLSFDARRQIFPVD